MGCVEASVAVHDSVPGYTFEAGTGALRGAAAGGVIEANSHRCAHELQLIEREGRDRANSDTGDSATAGTCAHPIAELRFSLAVQQNIVQTGAAEERTVASA